MTKSLKTVLYKGLPFLLLLGAVGCTINDTSNTTNNPITKQDLAAATQIIGESLSDNTSGAVLSISDALAIIGQHKNHPSVKFSGRALISPVPSGKQQYTHHYNPKTGVHTVLLTRQTKNPFLKKNVKDTSTYIYRDMSGNFIAEPQKQQTLIHAVHFTADRRVELSTLHKNATFSRKDTLLITGYQDAATHLTINGKLQSKGTITLKQSDGTTIRRSYKLILKVLDITVKKAALNKNLYIAKNSSGHLSWKLQLGRGGSSTTHLKGTIKLVGDGTALIRFQQSRALFSANLINGKVVNLNRAFMGRVLSVDVAGKQLKLANGLQVLLTKNTRIESQKYRSLQDVQNALNTNTAIWAQGKGTLKNGRFRASSITFKQDMLIKQPNSPDRPISFGELITSVNITAQTITIAGKIKIQFNATTIINPNGDYTSLKEVKAALAQNKDVLARGSVISKIGAAGLSVVTVVSIIFINA